MNFCCILLRLPRATSHALCGNWQPALDPADCGAAARKAQIGSMQRLLHARRFPVLDARGCYFFKKRSSA